MDITEFFPKYPNIDNTKYPVMNPYEDDFYEAILHKKEFYELKLDRTEIFPKERGMLTKYQKTIARYMSSHTPYDRLLLVHQMGLGKCVLPDTLIKINDTEMKAKHIWTEYMSDIICDNEGQWSKPNEILFVDSLEEKSMQIKKKIIYQLYRQYIREDVRKITTESGHTLSTTKRHKIWTKEIGWTNTPVQNLSVAVYENSKLTYSKIVSIEEFYYEGWVYDLEIEDYHNYVAGNIVTHNTCSAIGAIEQIKSEENTFNGALILAKGEGILDNFMRELVEKCTPGYYIPENYSKLTDREKEHRIKKKIKFYKLHTFAKFAKKISKLSDPDIIEIYSNKIIVIDEVHNLRPQEEKGTTETYNQFHRFLHLVKNCKVLFLSGTPMKDSPDEIATVSNLFLPSENQLPTGEEFLEEFMYEDNNVYYMKDEKIPILKEKLKGKISFLREPESTISKKFIGEENFGNLKHFVVAPNKMSSFQTKRYKEAYKNDKSGKKGVYINSREASLFVYPDGSYGKEGFNKYIKIVKTKKMLRGKETMVVSHYRLSDDLVEVLRGSDDTETLKNIKKYSATYAQVIEQILLTPGNCFVYSSLAQGSGGILFSLLLELFGFSKAKGSEKQPGLRYAILTHKTATSQDLRRITTRFNNKDNMHGEYIKVIIGSKAVSEGYSFKNVIFESINTPHWNYSETAQALARGIRLGSHNDLLQAGETPIVRILQPVSMPKDDTRSIDLFLYETSEDKDISIRSILRILMENAFDCALNYMRNFVDGTDYSRECDYTVCDYKCDGINMAEVENGIDDTDLDYSTYQLYYANPKTPLIRQKIEYLFRENHKIDLTSIIKNLSGQFTEEEIRNALYIIQEETQSEEFDYKTFLEIYSRSSVKKIMNELETMFKSSFKINFNNIVEHFKEYTTFEILSALQNIINDNLVLTDKYGLPCYLREEKNVYFLVNSISILPDFYTEYYTKYPHIKTGRSFTDIMNRIYSLSLPKLVEKICSTENSKDFAKLMKTLPLSIQELFIEASLIAQNKGIEDDNGVRQRVLDFFKSYVKQIDDVWVSTLLKNENILRCLEGDEWEDCEEKYSQILQESEIQRQQRLREENPYGIMGKYNPENGAFCLIDFQQEKQAKEKVSGKKSKVLDDKRVTYSGQVCGTGGWKLLPLIKLAATRLKINPPKDFRSNENKASMLVRIRKDETLSELLSENPDKDELRRILYWGTTKKENGIRGIKPICEEIRKWFDKNGLLEIDNQCGVQGKKKLGTAPKEEKEKVFRIETIIPSEEEAKFKGYLKDITKLMGDCFNIKKYKAPIDENTWIIVLSNKKVVGFLMVDKDNTLWNVCVAKNYRRQGIAKQAMRQATQFVCNVKGDSPSLYVDNRNKDSKRLIRMYNSFGFEIVNSDDKTTYMQFPCKE